LGDAAAAAELFVTDTWLDFPLSQLPGVAAAAHLQRPWDVSLRLKQFQEDEKRREENAARLAAGACHLKKMPDICCNRLPPIVSDLTSA
jgi:hypothetical protein